MMTAVEKVAAWTLSDHEIYRSPLALRQAKLLVLDSIGCAFAAIGSGAVQPVLDLVAKLGGTPEATAIGMPQKTSSVNAVLANGALVRVLDLNDVMFTMRGGVLSVSGHRSDNIPVALAVAESNGRSGREVLEAVILNYELYGRFRDLMSDDAPWDGSSASGMVAAAMAGRLMGLDQARLAHAIALAAIRTATPKIVRGGDISATKSLANAFAAQAGLHSALLAAEGVTGPLDVLEDRKGGLFQVFDPALGLERLWAPYPAAPQIMCAHVKSFPSIGTSQTSIEAALDLRARLGGSLEGTASIKVTMVDVPVVRRQQADPSRRFPRSREAADHSFAYLVAIALLDGELTHKQFDGERWLNDAAVRRLMDVVTFEVSDELAAQAPGSMPCRLEIEFADGRQLAAECLYPKGHSFPDGGLRSSVVEEKFLSVSRGIVPQSEAGKIREEVMSIGEPGALESLMSRLAQATPRTAAEDAI
jgi:2-methylcitrate dehydratase